jgi:hypothetical protein
MLSPLLLLLLALEELELEESESVSLLIVVVGGFAWRGEGDESGMTRAGGAGNGRSIEQATRALTLR